MTITQLIDELQGIYAEHGDVPVLDGKKHDFHARTIEVVTIDDWDNATKDGDYDIPAVGHAVAIGPRF
jgi:CobQ-like glutamine amidotransferase family enzyme